MKTIMNKFIEWTIKTAAIAVLIWVVGPLIVQLGLDRYYKNNVALIYENTTNCKENIDNEAIR